MYVKLKNNDDPHQRSWSLPRMVRAYDFDGEKATLSLTLKDLHEDTDIHMHLTSVRLVHLEHNGTVRLSGLTVPTSGTGEVPQSVTMEVEFGGD